ncbi:hypothetical protein ACHEXK_11130 [Limnohabitans sp. DCL3]|uniref:hypothetical protein n=1 Tax=Limnohabitans sp. DCL3 TaxID=3374103 RepID=UPI003A8B199D
MPQVPFLPSSLSSNPKETGRARRFALEGLEPRWLLSATPVAAALQAAFPVQEPEPLWHEAVQPTALSSAAAEPSGQLDLSQVDGKPGVFSGILAAAGVDMGQTGVLLPSSLGSDLGEARLQSVYGQARTAVQSFLGNILAQDLQALFPGQGSDVQGLLHTESVRQDWLQGAGGVTLTLASNEQLGGAMAAFTGCGPSGGAEVFVNRQWLNGLATDADLLRVLVEELGHGLDSALNGETDSPGDEGELFAAHVLALPLEPAQRQRMALEDDRAVLWWGMSSFVVEQANFSTNQNITGVQLAGDNTISGNVTLTSTYVNVANPGSNGSMYIGDQGGASFPVTFLDGDSDAPQVADHLTIKATGVVRFYSAVGLNDPLESLTITASTVTPTGSPSAVIFDHDVVLAGPLVIETDGLVTFSGKLTITGGSLTIRGASEIRFNNTVNVNGGSILLEGDEIELLAGSTLKSIGGVLTMRTTTLNLGMEVGSPAGVASEKLDLSATELSLISAGGFSKIILGHLDTNTGHATVGQGAVRIAGFTGANQYTFHAPLEVYGNTITIEDISSAANPGLAIKGSVKLDATSHIDIRNRLLASTDLSQASALQNITLYSATGQVTQSNETNASLGDGQSSEPLQGAALLVDAVTGINLFATEVNSASLSNSGSGSIRLVETAAGGALTLLKAKLSDTSNTSGMVSVQTLSSTDGDLTLTLAASTDVSSPGSVSLRAGTALTLGTNADLVLPDGADAGTDLDPMGGTLDLQAGTAMVLTGRSLKAVGDVRVQAGTSLALGKIQSSGHVALIAGSSITDGDADTLVDVSAAGLLVQSGSAGGVGTSADALESTVTTFTGAAGSGGIFVNETDTLVVDSLTVTVNRLSSTGTSGTEASSQSDLRTTSGNGAIVLSTTAGSLTLNDGNADGVVVSSHGTGHVLLQTLGAGTDISLNADVTSTNGNVSVRAAQALSFAADADVRTASTAAGNGHIDLEAGTGAITMNASSVLLSTGATAAARLLAGTSVTVGDISVASGAVSITAGSSILDADPVTTTNDTDPDITAVSLRLNAGTVIADSVNHLETTVGTLTASSAGSVYLLEADDLTVGSVAVSVNRVGSAAAVSTVTDAAQADVRTSLNGAIVLRSTAGSVTLNDGDADGVAISANGSGNVLVQAINAGKSITVNADVSSEAGNLSVLAGLDLTLGANADLRITGATPGTASMDAEATAGALLMSASSTMSSAGTGATARLLAGTSVTVGDISVASGAVSITAGSSILDADPVTTTNDTDPDITAVSLRLNAGTVIADSVNHLETTVGTLTASSAGSVYLLEADDLTVGSVAVSVNRVGSAAAVSTVTDAAQADVRTSLNGAIVLRSTAGSVTLNDGNADGVAISANGSGNVLVQAINAGTDITVNADIVSGGGNVSVLAARSVSLTGTADIVTSSTGAGNGSIDVLAGTGSITQSATSMLQSTGATASARLLAATDVTVGDIDLNTGKVSITATAGSILDADPVTTTNDTDPDITASALRLNAGMGIADSVNHLETTVGTLSARAGNGGIFLLEADALSVDDVGLSVNRVGSAAAVSTVSDAAQSDVRSTGGNGAIVLRTTAGAITLNNGTAPADDTAISANGSGHVLIQTLGAGTDITVNADIVSGGGNVSVLAARSVSLTGTADIVTSSTGAGNGSIDVLAGTGSITQSATSMLQSTGATASARLLAATDVTVGDIDLNTGKVSITATAGSILDADPVTTTNDTDPDITASALRLNAGMGIADSVNHLETTVGTLSARAGNGGIFLLEADALSVDDVGLSVNRVGSAAAVSTVSDAAQSDVRSTGGNGAIVLRTTAGAITLNNGTAPADDTAISANGSGHVLIQTLGAGTDITVNADIVSGGGNVSVLAARSVSLTGTADIVTSSTGAGNGSIDVLAGTGSITQSATSMLQSTGATASARLLAATDVTVGDIDLNTGKVSITATAGSILDADPVTTTNDTDPDITAVSLRLNAGTVIADSVNHLETTVGTLTASSAGSVYLLEADDLTVGSVAVSVNRVGSAAAVSTVTDAAQADVRTSLNGAIVLRSTAGSVTLNDGDADGVTISANGSGHVLLQTLGAGTDISLNADVTSTNGNVSVRAAQALSFAADADVRTASTAAGNGHIDLEAGTGAITMNASSVLLSTGATAAARLLAGTSVTVGDITVATGSISITATAGAIVDADPLTGATNDTDLDLSAVSLRMSAGSAIAASDNHLETAVGTLSAQAAGGGVFMLEADDLTVGSVAVSVNRVGSTAAVTAVSDVAQADVRTTGANGAIVLRSTAGSVTLNDGDADGVAISANGSGNVLVQAINAGKSITVNADVSSETGNLSVLAGLDLTLGANADLRITGATPGTASMDAEATAGALLMSASSTMSSAGTGATARLLAGTSVTVGDISVASGAVSITAGSSILDADPVTTTNDTDPDITAVSLRLNAGTVIADSVNHLETTVGTLTASSAGSVYLLEADDLTVGSVAVSVNRVGSAAAVSTVTDAAQADVRTSLNGAIVLRSTAGSVTLNDGDADGVAISANGSGNVLVQAINAGKSITVNADVSSEAGNLSVLAGLDLTLGANADLRITGATPGTASMDAEATAGALLMSASSTMSSAGTGATARLLAGTSVTVGDISVASGAVSITAGSSILDADPVTTTNDTDPDITAVSLRLNAGTVIADSVNHLETTVGTLTASSAGSVYLLEADDLTVGSVAVSVNRVGSAAAVSTVTDAAQADVRTSLNGAIVLRSTAGSVTLNDGDADGVAISANGSGNVLVQAINAGKSITVNADVSSEAGNLSVLAGLDLTLGANADLRITGATPGTASMDAEATAGALLMSASSTMSSAGTGATARLLAGTSVTVGDISVASGAVSITAGSSILDADPVTTTNDTDPDITAVSLRLNAGTVIADSVNHLETTVGTLTASSAGSVYLLEADDLTVGSVAVSVNRVGSAAAVSTVTDAAQADVRTSLNGAIVLRSTAGSVTLNDGNADGVAISANGSGHVLLQAQGAGSDLSVNAMVQSGTGHITLKATDAIDVSANVKTASIGNLSVSAGGALTQLGSTTLEATGSSLRLSAGQDLTLGNVVASQVSLVSAGGAVINAVGSSKNVAATVLRIAADDAVGTSARSLSTSVRTLSVASTGSQSTGVFLTEDNGLTLGSVSVSVTEVTSAGAAASSVTSDAAQSSVMAGGNSDMRLQLLAGDLVSTDASQSLKATRLLLQIDAGSAGANTLQKQNLLGSVIDVKATAAVDNVAELQQLADAVAAVLSAVVGGAGPSVAQLHALGVTGVTPQNLAAVHRALQATAEDGSGVDSLSELQAVVTQAQLVQPPVSLTQLAAIQQAAEDNNATEGKPSLTDYSQAAGTGNGGVLRVTAANIASINSVLNTPGVGSAQVDTVAEVQAVVDAYAKVLNAADAVDNDTLKPLLADYAVLGITGVDSALKVSLLGDVIDITARIHVDTAAELQVLADAVSATLAGVLAANPAPSLVQLQALGLTGLSPANLAAVQLAIRNTSDDGLGADTLPELQTLVNGLAPVAQTLGGAAMNNSATESSPSLATYTGAGITGVTSVNLAAINSALNSANVGAPEVDSAAEVQALVNAYLEVLTLADGAVSAADKPTRAEYELLGVSGLSAPVVALDVGTLALRVQPTGSGSAFLSNVGALDLNTVLGVAGAQVGGDWVLTSGTSATSLNVQANVITGGALRLDSRGSMSVLADVQAQGSLTLLAAGSMDTAVVADVLTLTGDVTLYAAAAMDLAGDVTSTQGSAWVQAGTGLTFETLNAENGKVVLQAGNAILGKTAAVDVRANALLVLAGLGAGSVANPLRVSVSELSVSAGGDGASLVQKDEVGRVDGLTVANLQNQSVQVVGANALLSTWGRSQSGVTVSSGGSLSISADTDLSISSAVDVGQNISLTAQDIAVSATTHARSGDITATADLISGSIAVSAITQAGDDISASANSISVTAATSAGDDITLVGDLITVGAAVVAGGDQSLRAISTLNASGLGRVQSGNAATVYMGVSAGSMTLSAGSVVSAGSGGASLTASQDVNLRGQVLAASTLDVLAGGAIDMITGSGVGRSQGNITAIGNVRMEAGSEMKLGSMDASTASVALKAGTSISDGDNDSASPQIDVSALGLLVQAGAAGGVGSASDALDISVNTFTALAGSAGVFVLESNDLTVDNVSVSVSRIDTAGASTAVPMMDQSDVRTTGGNGAIVLRTTAGSITLNNGTAPDDDSAISADGTGNVLVQALGAGTDITLNADISSGSGNLSVLAARNVSLTGTADLRTTSTASGSGSMDVQAITGSITQSATSLLTSTGASATARLLAGTDVVVGDIDLSLGQVSITASAGSIVDADVVSTLNDVQQNITAAKLRLSAGMGIAGSVNHLETTVGTLTARAANGGIYLLEADDLTVGDVGLSVNRVGSNAITATVNSTDAVQSDVRTTGGNGAIVLRTTAGSITLNNGTAPDDDSAISADGTGNVLVQALGAGTDITLNADISSGSGNLSVLAARNVSLTGTADLRTTSTASGSGSMDVQAITGSITQSATSLLTSTGASATARLLAGTDVVVGDIDLSLGQVSITASAGSIVDADVVSTLNDVQQNITAAKLRLSAGMGIAGSVNHLETTVGTLTARAANGGIYLLEADDLTVGDVGLSVNRVGSNAITATVNSTDAVQSDVRTTGGNGAIVLRTTAGSITLNNGTAPDDDSAISADGTGNVLVQALGAGTDITLNADISSGSGNLSVLAARNVSLTGTADLRTTSTASGSGSMDVQAITGSITQSATSLLTSTGASATARLLAGTDVVVGDIDLSLGQVSITASAGSIVDADVVSTLNDVQQNITAAKLRLSAGMGIAGSVNHLETTVGTLTARAANGGIYLLEADDLTVGDVGLSVNRVGSNAITATVNSTDAVQSDVRTTGGNGAIVLRTTAGSLTLSDGNADGVAIHAHGSGTVLLQAQGSGSDLVVNAAVQSATGHVTVKAADALNVSADVVTAGAGTLSLAAGGALTQLGTTTIEATGSSLRMSAGQDLSLGNVVANQVSLVSAGGAVVNSAGSSQNVTATDLRIEAANAVGTSARSLSTSVSRLSVASTGSQSAGVFLTENNGLTLAPVGVSVTEVSTTGVAQANATSDAPQSRLSAGGDSDMRLHLLAGDLVAADAGQSLNATRLLLQVDAGSVGTSAQVIPLNVGTLALRVQPAGTGSAFLSNVGALNVATVLGVTGAQVGGDWVLSSGSSADNLRVQGSVTTGGALRLDSRGNLIVQGDVTTHGGLTLVAAGTLDTSVGSDLLSQTGDVYLLAGTAIDLAGELTSNQGSAWVQAGSDLSLNTVHAATGKAVLLAGTGSVMGKTSAVDVRALVLLAQAGQGLGSEANALRVSVSDLSLSAGAGGVSMVQQDEGVRVSGVTVTSLQNQTVQTVSANAVSIPVVRSQSGITVTDLGSLQFSAESRMRMDEGVSVARDISLTADAISVAATVVAGGVVSARAVSDLTVTSVGGVTNGTTATLHMGVSAGTMTLSAGSVVQAGSAGVSLSASQDMKLLGQVLASGSLDALAGRDMALSWGTGSNRTEGVVIASGNVRLEAGSAMALGRVDASGASVALKAGTTITDGDSDDATPQVDVKALNLSVQSGTDVGTAGDRIDMAVGTLALQTTAGSAFINQTQALSVSALTVPIKRISSNGTALDHPDTGVVFDGLSLQGNLTMELFSGDLTVGGQGLQATGSVNLQLVGAVLDGDANGDTVDITAAALTVTAAGLGTAASRMETSLDSLTATVGTGGAHVVESDALLVSSLSSTGAVNLTTTAAASDLSVASLSAGGQSVTLVSQGAVLDGDAGNDGLDITAAALTVTAAGLGTAASRMETSLDSLTATVGTGGAHVVESDALLVSSLSSTGAVNLTTTAAASDLSVASLSAGGQSVTLVSQGAVLDGDAGNDGLDITAAALTVTAAGLGTAASRMETSLDSLTATVGTGGAHVVESDALLVSSLSSTGAVNLTTTAAASDLSVASLSAGGQSVTLVSQGAVLDGDAGNDGLDITAAALTVTAAGLGTAASRMETSLDSLTATVGTGGAHVVESDALLVSSLSSTGAVNLTTTAAASDLSVASLSAGGQSVTLVSQGAVLDGDAGNDGLDITAAALTVTAAGLGTAASRMETSLDSLTATVGTGGAHVVESDALLVSSLSSTGAVNLTTTAAASDLSVASLSAGGQSVTLVSQGAVLDGDAGNDGLDITAAALTVTAAGLGTAASRMETSLDSLTATVGTGGAHVVESDALLVSSLSSTGAVNLTTTAAASDLSVASLSAGGQSVTLVSQGAVLDGDAGNDGLDITAAALTVTAAGLGTAASRMETSLDSLTATVGTGGAHVVESDALLVSSLSSTGAVNLTTTAAASDLSVASLSAGGQSVTLVSQGAVLDGDAGNDGLDITAAALTVTAAGLGTAASRMETSLDSLTATVGTGGAHVVESDALLVSSLSSTGAVNLTTTAAASDLSVASLSAGGQSVTLVSQGAVLDGDAGNDGLDITAAALTVTAAGLGTAASRMETSLDSLTATVGTGGAHVVESDALLVSSLSSTGAVNLTTTAAASDLSVASLSAGGQSVTLVSQGAVLDGDAGNDGLDITAAALTVTAAGLGTAASRMETSLDSLTATVGTGGAHVVESDALLVSSLSSTGAVNLTTTAAASDLSVASLSAGGQSVTLVSQGAVLDGDAGNDGLDITAAALTVTAAGLGTAASRMETSLDSLTATVGTGGAHVVESDALLVSSLSSTGAVNLTTTAAASDLSVASLSAGGQSVTLVSQGAVLDGDAGNDGLDITAAALTVTAAGLGTAASRMETSLDSLTATVGTGGAHVVESDALLVSSLSSTGAVNLTTTAAASDLSVASLSAGGQSVTLVSQGAVLDGDANGDTVDITAAALTVTAAGLGTAASRMETSLDSLTATVGTGGAHVVESDALLVSSLSSTGAVNLTTTAAASDLSVASLSAGGQSVTLVSQGAVLDGDANGDTVDITAAALTVTAAGLGTAASRMETSLDSLTATVGTGGAHVVESDALLVSSLSSTGAVNLTTTAAASDLSVASLSAGGQSVTLVSQGAVLNANSSSSAVNITAAALTVTAAGLGNVALPMNTSVNRLGGELGTGGMSLDNSVALLVKDLTTTGAVILSADGDLSVAAFNATGQAVNLNATGAVLDGNIGSEGVELKAGKLTLNATGLGSQASPLKTNIDSLTAAMGAGGVFMKDADAVEVLGISGSGPLNVQAPVGAFEVKRDLVLSSPLVLQSEDIQISANMSGPRLDVVTPTLAGASESMPLVLGSLVANVTPDNGVHISSQEAARLQFDTIVLGTSQADQAIWFQTTPNDASDRLTFTSKVAVETLGNTRFSGLVTGTGLQVKGPGHTTFLDDADILQTKDVVINDRVVVTKTSLVEVIGGKLSLHGGLTVQRDQTLTLLASEIDFGPFVTGTGVAIVLEEGATLVLGATRITWDREVTFDSDGGHVVLRGAPNTTQLQLRDRLPDAAPLDFAPSALDFAVWMNWLAADQDGDAGLRSLTLGDAAAITRIPSAKPWTILEADSVILRGTTVHLGSAGEPDWTLTQSAVLRATAGSLDLHVGLDAMGDVSLVSTTGQVRMGADVAVVAVGAVAMSAATGMVVGHLDSEQRIDLYSHNANGPQGSIVSAAAAASGDAHVTAPAVSVHGYGQRWATADTAQMLTVNAQALQVSAPSGVASRGLTSSGMVYRLMDQGVGYLQVKLVGEAPQRVMVSASQVQTELTAIREGFTPALAWQPAGQTVGLAAWVPISVSRYLLSQPAPVSITPSTFMADSTDDLLSDMAYGLSPDDNTVVLSLELDAPLVRSTGQLLTESDWTLLPQ